MVVSTYIFKYINLLIYMYVKRDTAPSPKRRDGEKQHHEEVEWTFTKPVSLRQHHLAAADLARGVEVTRSFGGGVPSPVQ